MKSISMKIYMSVFALLLTVSALAATTFAWFTLGNTAQVNSFEGDVYAGEGLEVRLIDNNGDAVTPWSSYIASTDIQDLIDDNGFVQFKAVTTENTTSFTTVLIDNESVTNGSAAQSEYIKFRLEFRTKQTEADLLWTKATLSGGTDVSWLNDGNPFKDALGNDVNTNASVTENVANAARVAVVNGSTVLGYELPEENNNVQGKGTASVGAHSFIKSRYQGIETLYNSAHASAMLVVTENVNTTNPNVVAFGGTADADADGYVYVTLDVFVWIEGWDANTYNPILGQTLTASLEFKLSA